MQSTAHELWVEKYRPQTIDQYIFHDPVHKSKVLEMIENKTIPHILLAGIQGSGKTTLARILIKAIDVDENDILTINASDERGIDTFRDAVKSFAGAMPMGNFKVIHLEEADRLTPQAQDALKSFMEDASEYVRFILTCNRIHMITGPIRSRCQEFILKPTSKDDSLEYLVTLLASEKVKFKLETLEEYVDIAYPDTRKVVNMLSQYTVGGVLQSYKSNQSVTSDYQPTLLKHLQSGDWESARALIGETVQSEDWDDFFDFLYNNIHTLARFAKRDSWEEAIILINEHAEMHTRVANPQLNATALLIKLSKI